MATYTREDYEALAAIAAAQLDALRALSDPREIDWLIRWHSGMLPERTDISDAYKAARVAQIKRIVSAFTSARTAITWEQFVSICRSTAQQLDELEQLTAAIADAVTTPAHRTRSARRAAERAERRRRTQ